MAATLQLRPCRRDDQPLEGSAMSSATVLANKDRLLLTIRATRATGTGSSWPLSMITPRAEPAAEQIETGATVHSALQHPEPGTRLLNRAAAGQSARGRRHHE